VVTSVMDAKRRTPKAQSEFDKTGWHHFAQAPLRRRKPIARSRSKRRGRRLLADLQHVYSKPVGVAKHGCAAGRGSDAYQDERRVERTM